MEHDRGRDALYHHLRVLKSEGQEMLVARLEPQHPSEKENACAELLRLGNGIDASLKKLDWPPILRFATPGRAIVSWRLGRWSDAGGNNDNWRDLAGQLDNAREVLDAIHAALQRPAYDSGVDYNKGFVDFQFAPLTVTKNSALLLHAATLNALKNGNLAAAHGYLTDLIKLAALQHPEPLIVLQLGRQACADLAFAGTWQALQAPGWNEAQLASMQSAWTACDFPRDMAGAMEMERAMTYDYFEQLKKSWAKLTLAADQREQPEAILGNDLLTHGFTQWVRVPIWRFAWLDQDELMSLHRQTLVERGRMARTNCWLNIAKLGPAEEIMPWFPAFAGQGKLSKYDRFRFLVSSSSLSVNDDVVCQTLRTQLQQQMALTAIAISRYRLQEGTPPPDLSALVPKFLPTQPRDSMDGKALRYRLQPGHGFLLYSVGEDGKDDGGAAALRHDKNNYSGMWDGQDAVWPTAATDEQVAAALKRAGK